MRRIFWALILFGLVLPAEEGLSKVRFGTPIKAEPVFDLLLLAAQEKGVWKEQGLDVEWTAFESGVTMRRAMVAGSMDMGMVSAAATILGIASRPAEIIVADSGAQDATEIYVPSGSPIREPKDLKGARLGVARLGGLYHILGQAVAKDLRIDMKYVGLGGTHPQLAGLKAGAVDAVLMGRGTGNALVLKGELRRAVVVQDHLPSPWVGIIIFAGRDFAAKQAETVPRVLKAFFRAADFLMKNRAWALEKSKASYGHSEAEANWVFDNELRYGKDGRIDPRAIENVRNFLVEYGMIPKDKVPSLEALFTSKFVE